MKTRFGLALFACLLLVAVFADAGWYATHIQRPVIHGLQLSTSQSNNLAVGQLEAVVLSRGQPWGVYPSPVQDPYACNNSPQAYPYYSSSKLWQFNRYATTPVFLYQPQTANPTDRLVYAQVWDNILNHADVYHPGFMAAAGALDNNNVYGDFSLNPTTNEITPYFANGTSFTKLQGWRSPDIGNTATIYTGDFRNTGQYNIPVQIVDKNDVVLTGTHCSGVPHDHYTFGNMVFNSQGRALNYGDIGSPVVTDGRDGRTAGLLLGWLEWANLANPYQGGGADVNITKTGLNFDSYFTARSGVLDSLLAGQTSSSLPVGQQVCSSLYVWNQNPTNTAPQIGVYFTKATSSPATFSWFNPAGQPATPYDIPANATVPYTVCLKSTSAYGVSDYRFLAYGPTGSALEASVSPVVKTALNTMMARWNPVGTPNFTISQQSASNNDIASTGNPYGATLIKITAQNIGNADLVTIAADTNTVGSLPMDAQICETVNFSTCLQPYVSHFTEAWSAAATKKFLIKLSGLGTAVPLNKFYSRVYFRVYEGTSVQNADMLGSASLAATTS